MTPMFLKKASLALLVGVASLAMVNAATAATIQLGNSGWSATWSSSKDANISLNVDFESSDTVFLEKFVQFTTADIDTGGFIQPAVIVFQQTSANAKPFIVINDEQVINATGQAWNGFTMLVDPGSSFDTGKTAVSPPGTGFSIDPFTQHVFSNSNTQLDMSGATIPTGPPVPGPGDSNVWFPGVRSGGLAIVAGPLQTGLRSFRLKEQPQTTQVIPLPAAAWSGLSALGALGLVAARKRISRIFA